LRPADANEVVEAYRYVMQLRHKPAVLALSRQPLPTWTAQVRIGVWCWRTAPTPSGRSGVIPKLILNRLWKRSQSRRGGARDIARRGMRSRVSRASWTSLIFSPGVSRQRSAPKVKARVAVEQASTFGWSDMSARRPRDRDEDFRGLGAAQGASEEIWFRAGRGGGGAKEQL